MKKYAASDFIINADGSIYHLNLHPQDVADTVITVGDPDRVSEVSKYFDEIELKKGKREFITHTGYIDNQRITVISTGIGTDNIDIVLNELDALVNIDFEERCEKSELKKLQIIRIGTSGTVQNDIPLGTILASKYGIGLDALMHYYTQKLDGDEQKLQTALLEHFKGIAGIKPYIARASNSLLNTFEDVLQGITLTAPGFYAPQGRILRAENKIPNLVQCYSDFEWEGQKITNLEMETAGIYAMAKVLGHEAISINAILANRQKMEFHSEPQKVVENAIQMVLEKISAKGQKRDNIPR